MAGSTVAHQHACTSCPPDASTLLSRTQHHADSQSDAVRRHACWPLHPKKHTCGEGGQATASQMQAAQRHKPASDVAIPQGHQPLIAAQICQPLQRARLHQHAEQRLPRRTCRRCRRTCGLHMLTDPWFCSGSVSAAPRCTEVALSVWQMNWGADMLTCLCFIVKVLCCCLLGESSPVH